jgi:hypothetical protein
MASRNMRGGPVGMGMGAPVIDIQSERIVSEGPGYAQSSPNPSPNPQAQASIPIPGTDIKVDIPVLPQGDLFHSIFSLPSSLLGVSDPTLKQLVNVAAWGALAWYFLFRKGAHA